MSNKIALVSGVTGMDGSHLSELLLKKGYSVYGFVRRTAHYNLQRIENLLENQDFHILYGDVTDQSSIINAIETAKPDEFYNLAAMSFVGESWNQPLYTFDVTAKGCLNCLESIRIVNKNIKFLQASSSEMFGKVLESPQKETTPFYPRSPYGVAKAAAHYITVNYRESYGMFACASICFNHESPRRGTEFVTRKITQGICKIKAGLSEDISLGNLDAKRDWGDARDFVRGMFLIMQQQYPEDYILATGKTRSVRDFLRSAFLAAGYSDPDKCIEKYVKQDARFMRPADVDILLGDASKAKEKLGWIPEIDFDTMVKDMVDTDMCLISG